MERWGTTEEFTVITDEIIDAALTPRGGITRSQLEAVGLSWPKPLDWPFDELRTNSEPRHETQP